MQQLRFNELLRYAFSGAIAIFTLVIIYNPTIRFFMTTNILANAVELGVVALLVGTLIYSLYRSVLYPLIYRILLIALSLQGIYQFRAEMLIPWRPTRLELELDIKRWRARKDEKSVQKDLVEWASQVHFLWTTSIAIMGASWIGANLSPEGMLSQNPLKLADKKKAQGEVNSENNKLVNSLNSERYKRHGQEEGSTAAG